MRIFFVIFSIIAAITLSACKKQPTDSGDPVSSASAIGVPLKCISHGEYWITSVTGPCDGFNPVSGIAVGDKFMADGKERTINVIRRFYNEKDWEYGGEKFKAGYYCTAGESISDLDTSLEINRVWIYIPQCEAQ